MHPQALTVTAYPHLVYLDCSMPTACQHQIVARSHYKELVEPKAILVHVHVRAVIIVLHEQLSSQPVCMAP